MRWHFFVAYFFGGAFLVNAIPHFVQGISGGARRMRWQDISSCLMSARLTSVAFPRWRPTH